MSVDDSAARILEGDAVRDAHDSGFPVLPSGMNPIVAEISSISASKTILFPPVIISFLLFI